jgi:hypothetical protein
MPNGPRLTPALMPMQPAFISDKAATITLIAAIAVL